ncbi:MAG TPA: glycosyltransferase, partial [Anaerolineales bacterium]
PVKSGERELMLGLFSWEILLRRFWDEVLSAVRDVPAPAVPKTLTTIPDKIPLLAMTDPFTSPTGFGRVGRELFRRIPQDRFRLGYLGRGWAGSRLIPGISTYAASMTDSHCQQTFPVAAMDFSGKEPFLLWTLMDPWQTSWLSYPDTSPLKTPRSTEFLEGHRHRFRWIGHFPIDGLGPMGGLPLFVKGYIDSMDVPVAMSEWAAQLIRKETDKDVRMISHAVDTAIFYPDPSKEKARKTMDGLYFHGLSRELSAVMETQNPDEFIAEVNKRLFHFDGFIVLCVMANRERKYWWDVLRAFRTLLDDVPDAKLIGVCGHRDARNPGSYPLEDLCHALGLRLEMDGNNPNVWLIETVSTEDFLRLLNRLSDVSLLISGGEGRGLPQQEAHACGRPCIVGDYSASTEIAVDSRELVSPRGFYHMANNVIRRPVYEIRDIADRLKYAARNPSWRDEVGAKGIEQAKLLSWERILPVWIDLFEEAWHDLTLPSQINEPETSAAQTEIVATP